MTPTGAPGTFEYVAPILRVRDLRVSIDYYLIQLGFKLNWEAPNVAEASRDRCGITLSEGDQGNPGSWVWIGVGDAEALHEEYRAACAKIRLPPTNYYWALEMQVEDLDGNVLRFGSEPKTGQPFGEWLDMHVTRWAPAGDRGWRRVEEH